MKRAKKYTIALIAIMVIILGTATFTACGEEEEQPINEPNEPIEEVISYTVKLYYANDEYIETGDESLPKFIVEEAEMEAEDDKSLYMTLLEQLMDVPEEGISTMITDEIHFNDVYISEENDDTIIVDISSEGLSGGSLGESIFVGQIVQTLLENQELSGDGEIPSKVQFLVDGQVVESLMGHIDASEPFTKE